MGSALAKSTCSNMRIHLVIFVLLACRTALCSETGDVTGDWSPDPCFPLCTTDSALTSPLPDRGCIKTDCFDEPLCRDLCSTMGCWSFEWILNNDDNDIFGETWCAVDGYGMCYCCDCD